MRCFLKVTALTSKNILMIHSVTQISSESRVFRVLGRSPPRLLQRCFYSSKAKKFNTNVQTTPCHQHRLQRLQPFEGLALGQGRVCATAMNGVRTTGNASVVSLLCFAYRPCSGQAPRPLCGQWPESFGGARSQLGRDAPQRQNLMLRQPLPPLRQSEGRNERLMLDDLLFKQLP